MVMQHNLQAYMDVHACTLVDKQRNFMLIFPLYPFYMSKLLGSMRE